MGKYIDSRTEGTLPRSHFTIRQSGGLGPVSVSPIVGSPLLKKYSSTYPIEFVAKFRNASPPQKNYIEILVFENWVFVDAVGWVTMRP